MQWIPTYLDRPWLRKQGLTLIKLRQGRSLQWMQRYLLPLRSNVRVLFEIDRDVLKDTIFDNNQDLDSIYYVALDLVLASKASMLATCTERCHWPKQHYCKKCIWIGNFAHLALELRGDEKANSLPCCIALYFQNISLQVRE